MDIDELKNIQKRAIKNLKIVIISGILLMPTWLILAYFSFKNENEYLLIISTIIIFILCLVIDNVYSRKKLNEEFREEYKKTFILSSLNDIFDNLKYFPDSGLSESVIENTNMMKMGNRYYSNDYFEGEYKGVEFCQSDVCIEKEKTYVDSDGQIHTSCVTLFKGKWMIFDFNKNFTTNIQIVHKDFKNSKVSNWLESDKYKKIEMEDIKFNKEFKVYAQDEHNAFYILTPILMEKIKHLGDTVFGEFILCFIDNKLHIGLNNGYDSFEHSIYSKIDEEKEKNKISKDIKIITDFVDELNLDNKIFKEKA